MENIIEKLKANKKVVVIALIVIGAIIAYLQQ